MKKEKFVTLSRAMSMAIVALFTCLMFSACSKDDEPTVKFTLGDVVSNTEGVTVIGKSSVEIHYDGEIDYDAGFILSTSPDFTQGLRFKMASLHHKASNHESSTGYNWEGMKFTHDFPTGTTVYYTVFTKFYDESEDRHGPVKSFVAIGPAK